MQLISPEEVTFVIETEELDDLGEYVGGTVEELPCLAVVAPGSTADLDATRPSGYSVSYTLHLPKAWSRDLRGASVRLRGEEYRVVGEPMAYTAANTPGDYCLPVEVGRADG
jgi:hypothetical protein